VSREPARARGEAWCRAVRHRRVAFLFKEQENGIGAVIGVESAGLDERLDEGCGKPALPNQILADAPELGRVGRRQSESRLGRRWLGLGAEGAWKRFSEPSDGLAKAQLMQVHHQVNGPTPP